jgi:hypothetical protein
VSATPPDPLASVDLWVALDDGRAQLLAAIDGLDAGAAGLRVEGGAWRILDALSHIAAWDELHASFLRALAAGRRDFEVVASPEHAWAAWNAERIAEAEGATLAAALERLHAARAEMLEALASLEAACYDERLLAPWGYEDSVRGFMVAQAMHDGGHAEAIRAARAGASHE